MNAKLSADEKRKILKNTRQELNSQILTRYTGSIWRHFRGLGVDTSKIDPVIANSTFKLYKAPLSETHGSNMMYWPENNERNIYINNDFMQDENRDIIIKQLTHEMLHAISWVDYVHMFGRKYEPNIIGIYEATTQVFADDINGAILTEDKDYLYFIKGIMRVMSNIVGKDKLASQYLNIDNSFEQTFSKALGADFNKFVSQINQVYKLSKKQYYDKNSFTQVNEIQLEELKENLLDFVLTHLQQKMKENPDFADALISDFNGDNFLEKYDLLREPEKDEISFNQVNRHERISRVPNRTASANQMSSTIKTPDNTKNRVAVADQMNNTVRMPSDAKSRAANMMGTAQIISKQSINRIIAQNNITITEVSQTTDTMLRQQRYKELNHKKTIGTLTLAEDEELKKMQPRVKRPQRQTMKKGR